jgi:hypothetical protein
MQGRRAKTAPKHRKIPENPRKSIKTGMETCIYYIFYSNTTNKYAG